MNAQRAIWILWPSFIVGGVATGVFFTLFDPRELTLFGEDLGLTRLAVYSIGFFVFWAFAAASSALTCFFQRTSAQINRGGAPIGTASDIGSREAPDATGGTRKSP
jgi:hypothetical protein